MSRYAVQRQEDGRYRVWDTERNEAAKLNEKPCVDRTFEEALDCAASLNLKPPHP
jgi:hypothetical protein